ncbi:MAG: exo-alpha-sialidase [Flavobacteriales bacterium]
MRPYRFILIGCVNCAIAFGQFTNTRISPVNQNPVEPSVAINPLNTKEVAIGAVLDYYYYSSDKGLTWKATTLTSTYGVYGDPVLQYDAKGRLYYFHLSDYPKGYWIDRIVCQYSDNPSEVSSFTAGSFPKPFGRKAQDKHWVDIDPKSGTIYMTWTQFDKYDSKNFIDSSRIMFSKSTNRGVSWTDPIVISFYNGDCLDGDNTVEGAVPVVGVDGDLFVTWTGPKGLMLQKSSDAGQTWLPIERTLMQQPGGWDFKIPGIYRCNGLPVLQVDRSTGKNHGTLYLCWSDQRNGAKDTDIWLIKSDDNGTTWTKPIRVNQDKTKTHQFMASFTIDQSNGNLHFLFYDRSMAKQTNETHVVWVSSIDGGRHFDQRRISEKSFIPNPKGFFGDYIAIAAVQGTVVPVWVRADGIKMSLWTANLGLK